MAIYYNKINANDLSDINQVTSIKIPPPSDTQVKKDSDKVFDGWCNQVFDKYKTVISQSTN